MYLGRLIAGFVGFIIFIIILVMLFGHGGKKPAPLNPIKPLAEYAQTDATVTFTSDGIVNGDELHRAIRITISANQRQLDVLQGYNPQVIQSKTFINNQEAYTVFLKAIARSGFVAKLKNSKAPADERGVCPLGFRYILTLNDGSDDISRLWASTCGSKVGTSGGAITTLHSLFQAQIPNYQTLTSQVNLSATREQ
ncbi:hypothetical protein KW801_01685 [Candidatus Saccharibacteria bacterium]|nr:hypothetical protein [Candidatus Saccharibacteria bacterium]